MREKPSSLSRVIFPLVTGARLPYIYEEQIDTSSKVIWHKVLYAHRQGWVAATDLQRNERPTSSRIEVLPNDCLKVDKANLAQSFVLGYLGDPQDCTMPRIEFFNDGSVHGHSDCHYMRSWNGKWKVDSQQLTFKAKFFANGETDFGYPGCGPEVSISRCNATIDAQFRKAYGVKEITFDVSGAVTPLVDGTATVTINALPISGHKWKKPHPGPAVARDANWGCFREF